MKNEEKNTIRESFFHFLINHIILFQRQSLLEHLILLIQFIVIFLYIVTTHVLQFEQAQLYYGRQLNVRYILHSIDLKQIFSRLKKPLVCINCYEQFGIFINHNFSSFFFEGIKKNQNQRKFKKVYQIFFVFNFSFYGISISYFLLISRSSKKKNIQTFKYQGFLLSFLFGIFPIILVCVFNLAGKSFFLYDYFQAPLLFCLSLQNILCRFLFLLISAYMILKNNQYFQEKDHLFKKILYGQLFIVQFWVVIRSFSSQYENSSNLNTISFLYLLIMGIAILIMLLFFKEKFIFKQKSQKENFIFQILQNCSNQIMKQVLTYKQLLKIFQILNLNLNRQRLKQIKSQKKVILINNFIKEKNIKSFKKSEILTIFIQHLQQKIKVNKSINFIIMLLKLKLMRKDSILQIYQLIQKIKEFQNKNLSLFWQYQIFKVKIQTQKELFHKAKLKYEQNPLNIVDLQQACSNFHLSFHNIIFLLQKFWTFMSSESIKQQVMDEKFDQILQEQKKLQENYKILTLKNYSPLEQNIYKVFKDLTFNQNLQIRQENHQNFEEDYDSYIIFDKEKIIKCSFKLLKQLSITDQEIINQKKEIIFSEEFSPYIDQKIKSLLQDNGNQQFPMPILDKNKHILLKRAKLFVYPEISKKMKFLIKFKSIKHLQQSALLVYFTQIDCILYCNKQFFKQFQIDQQYFYNKLHKNQLLAKQIFSRVDLSSQEAKKMLIAGNFLKIVLNLKHFSQQKKVGNIFASIKLIQSFKVNSFQYMFLKIKKSSGSFKNMSYKSLQTEKAILNKQSTSPNLADIYQNQTFFCKIPNSYQEKINIKKIQLIEASKNSFKSLFFLPFVLLFFCFLTQTVHQNQFTLDRLQEYQNYNYAVSNVSNQFMYLFKSYSCAYKHYIQTKYPQQYLKYNKKDPFIDGQTYSLAGQYYLKEFQKIYLKYMNNQPNSVISYNLIFQGFNVTTSTSESTLLDYSQNLKKYFNGGQIDFLLKNYVSLRGLSILYCESFKYKDLINGIIQKGAKINLIFIVFTLSIFVLCFWALTKLQQGVNSVYQILEKIDQEDASEMISKIQQDLQANQIDLSKNNEINFTSNQKQTQQLSTYLQKEKDKFSHQYQSEEQNQKLISKMKTNQNEYHLKEDYNKLQLSKKRVHKINTTFSITCKKYLLLLLFILAEIFIIMDNFNSISNQRKDIFQIIAYQNILYKSLVYTIRDQVSDSHPSIYYDYFKVNVSLPSNPFKTILSHFQTPLPEYFQQFIKQSDQLLHGDLCKIHTEYKSGQNYPPCESMINGIFTQGFGKVYQTCLELQKKVRLVPLSKYYDNFCTIQYCPTYQKALFCTFQAGKLLQLNAHIFIKARQKFSQRKKMLSKNRLIRNILLLLLVFGISFYSIHQMKNTSKRCIKYFIFLPKNFLFQKKMINYIKNENILQKLEQL